MLIVSAGWLVPLGADTVTLEAEKDVTIMFGFGDNGPLDIRANGGSHLHAGGTQSGKGIRRALIEFDVSSIPGGSTINSATLTLHVLRHANSATATTMDLHRVTREWSEGPSGVDELFAETGEGWPAQAGDCTWVYATNPTAAWNTPGGDFEASASATAAIPLGTGIDVTWSSAGMASDVESWVNNAGDNHGWILMGPQKRVFAPREDAESIQPTLQIDYTPGATNLAPEADAGTDIEEPDTDGDGTESVTLDGSGSGDLDGTVVSWDWSWNGGSASGETAVGTFPVGTTTVTLTVTDNGGETDSDTVDVTVLEYSDNDILADDWERAIVEADAGDAIETIDDVLPEDDFNGDGVSNVIAYALGFGATEVVIRAPGSGYPEAAMYTERYGLQLSLPVPRPEGISYVVEKNSTLASGSWSTLATWNAGAGDWAVEAEATVTPVGSGGGKETYHVASSSADPSGREFQRLRLAY
jgi:hypothetical protein